MKILEKKLSEIKPYEKNPRINDHAIDALANSIKEFGFNQPIVIDNNNVIVCGHTRYKAMQKLNAKTIPCIMAEDLTPEQIKAYRLADNKTAELSTWDFELLDKELDSIFDFDMSDFGFDFSTDTKMSEADNSEAINEGSEINISEYDDNSFPCQCPRCGFRFER